MTVNNVAGPPANIPNKAINIINIDHKWSSESLEALKTFILNESSEMADFDKLDNPLLNGLKKFAKTNLVHCKKCDDMVKVSLNGVVKSTFQFDCKIGNHHISATQILGSLPDEWILEVTESMEESNRIQTLKWLDKAHLSEDLWEAKGLKNAMKRFAVDRSPIKMNDQKIRIINVSLETEVNELKKTVEQLIKRQNAIEEENLDLKSALKAAKEEVSMLRRLLSEEKDTTDAEPKSFAAVTAFHRPPKPRKPMALTPTEVISKPVNDSTAGQKRYPYSPLKIYFFEGCHRKSPGVYRAMLQELGFNARQIRDITFLSEDIMQVTLYESAIEELTKVLQGISENVKRLDNFDPTKAANYKKYGDFTDEDVKASYFAVMTKSAERLSKAADNVKGLRRSANFFKKVIESQNIDYQSTPRKEKVFFLGSLIEYVKPAPKETVNPVEPSDDDSMKVETTNENQQ